jgi:hypothetical protein
MHELARPALVVAQVITLLRCIYERMGWHRISIALGLDMIVLLSLRICCRILDTLRRAGFCGKGLSCF